MGQLVAFQVEEFEASIGFECSAKAVSGELTKVITFKLKLSESLVCQKHLSKILAFIVLDTLS
jgi:hypothetical protein